MPSAARMADQTGHGSPLNPGPGCLSVSIGFRPAWRALPSAMASAVVSAMSGLSDMHLCPLPVPPPPHGPGFVTRGSSTVNIGNLPAARLGDTVFEACGGTDLIAGGCTTVNIGG